MEKEEKYMNVKVASYALGEVLLSLLRNGYNRCAITKEDNDLILRLSEEDLEIPYKSYRGEAVK